MSSSRSYFFFVLLLALIALPVYQFITRSRILVPPKNFNDEHCRILNFTDVEAVEDITKIFEDESVVDFLGAWTPRRSTWLNHSHVSLHPSSTHRAGNIHIRVFKKKGNCQSNTQDEFVRDCIQIRETDSKLKDADKVPYHPHGLYYDSKTKLLHALNHAGNYGGDRIDIFKVDRSADRVATTHIKTINYAAGQPHDDPKANHYNYTGWMKSGIAPKSSAFGVMNDFAVDRVTNRRIISQWKAFPSSSIFPRRNRIEDHIALPVVSLLADSTFLLSCPMESSTLSDPPHRQCIRSKQRFSVANGVITNTVGNLIIVADFVNYNIAFLTANKLDENTPAHKLIDGSFSPFNLIGKFQTLFSTDNIEFHSESESEICMSIGGGQRIVDPGIYLEKNPNVAVPAFASKVCCKKSKVNGLVENPASDCVEELLYANDASDPKNHLSGVSIAVTVDSGSWRKDGKNILIMGSFIHEGVGVCFV